MQKVDKKKDVDELDDLFDSGQEEDEEVNAEKEKRLKGYAEKKSKKPALVAKSSVVFDVKPCLCDETDMKKLEERVRSIKKDGLVWGASKLATIACNIKKLVIVSVVEDDKVGIEQLSQEIEAFEDYVLSVDIAAFNKI